MLLLFLLLSVTTELFDELLLSQEVLLFLHEGLQSLPILIEVVFLELDHLALHSLVLVDPRLSIEHVVEVVIEVLLVPPGLVLKIQLHCHCLIQGLLILLGSFILLEKVEDIDLPQPQIQGFVLDLLESLVDPLIHLICPCLPSL
jgi:hypothetical protein